MFELRKWGQFHDKKKGILIFVQYHKCTFKHFFLFTNISLVWQGFHMNWLLSPKWIAFFYLWFQHWCSTSVADHYWLLSPYRKGTEVLTPYLSCGNKVPNQYFIFQTDDDPPLTYSQTFTLKPIASSFYVQHDIFRLGLHDSLWLITIVNSSLCI